jgi:cardiolipin synthase A/B
MFPVLTAAYWLTLHGIVTIVAVLLYIVTSHVLRQRRHPTAAIAWVLFILLVPYLALPAFWTFGSRKQARPRITALRITPPAPSDTQPEAAWAVQTALALGQPAPAAFDDLHVHADGNAALQALWATLDGARHTLDICTFLIGRDAVGAELIARLMAKVRAGVKVRLMIDGMGRIMAGSPSLKPLVAAGAQVTRFVPPLHSPLKGRTNLRDHRKMVIADAGEATARLWSGGRNLAGEYFTGSADAPPWRDLSFDLHGALVAQAHELFEHDWAFANGRRLPLAPDAAETLAAPDAPDRAVAVADDAAAHGAPAGAQVVASGPDQIDDTVYALLLTAAYRARRRIAIVTPYFVPDAALLMALGMAARRGVVVDLLVPARSNHALSDMARRRALRTLADAGGRIWLAPGMLHAKLVVVDDVLALAGSVNIDSRSLFLNYEMMLAFHDAEVVERFAQWFEAERALAQRSVPKQPGLVGDVADGLVLWLGFQL